MTLRPTSSRSRSSASAVAPASRSSLTASWSSWSALPVIWWKPYSSPRAASTVSSASESLPRPSTSVPSRSGLVRSSATGSSSGRRAPLARRETRRGSGARAGDADQSLGQLPTVRGGSVGAEQPAREVHAVDDQVDLRGEILAGAGDDLVGEPLEPAVQLELVVGGGAARGMLRIVVLAAHVVEGAAAEAGAGDVALDGVDDRQQRGARVTLQPDQFRVDEREHRRRLACEVGADEVVFALEEPVDGHLAQTGLPDQLVHSDAARATAGEESLGGVQDDRLPLGAAAAKRSPGVRGSENVVGGGERQGGGH